MRHGISILPDLPWREAGPRWQAGLGFTDTITHWPRSDSPYAGSLATLAAVASDVVGPASGK